MADQSSEIGIEPGTALDSRIAREFFEMEVIPGYESGTEWNPSAIPDYSTDISDAWKIVKRLEDIFDFAWTLSSDATGYTFRIFNDTFYKGFVGKGETESLAICRCALAYLAENLPHNSPTNEEGPPS